MLSATILLTIVAQGKPEPNLVVGTGVAYRTFVADAASVGIGSSATAADPAAARAASNALQSKAQAAARDAVATKKLDFDTFPTSVRPEYEAGGLWGGGLGGGHPAAKEPAVKDYLAQTYSNVRRIDLDQVDGVLHAVAQVDGASATVSEYSMKDEAAARRAVLKDAFLDAKAKAQDAAEAAGLHLGAVYLLDPGDGATLRSERENDEVSSAPGASSHPVKRVTGYAKVTVRFYLLR